MKQDRVFPQRAATPDNNAAFFAGDSKMTENVETELEEDRKEKFLSRVFFWGSMALSLLSCLWYYQATPPDDPAMQRKRVFIAQHAAEILTFLRLPYEEQKEYAENTLHPFFKEFMNASEVEKLNIKALVHNSTDYKPNQYWVNMFFLWIIAFTTYWFLGLAAHAVIQLSERRDGKP
jgi:FtsH-binding integral membrane protein